MATEKEIAVLLFTDIVSSVALQSKLGTEAYTRYITRHDALFKQCLSHVSNSHILNETGDGFLVKFSSASDGVETALRLQCLLRTEICEGEPMVLRIGLHMGEVSEMEEQITGEKRAVGMAINLCARIMDLAADGQILLTRAVFDEARQYTREHPALGGYKPEDLPPLQWPAHGRYLFKGTEEPMDIYEVGAAGWAPLTPPDDSAKAKRAVSADEEATLGWRPGAGLPIPRHEKWVIVRKLGQGGFGEVWLAEHGDTKNQRVFKFCFDPEKLRSFKRELTLFRLLRDALGNRDDIAALYDVSVESPPFYLESEFVPAGNMAHWAESKGGLQNVNLETRIDLIARTARALAAAHSVGIIHKDIKPSNILIHEADGKALPRIADFGIGTLSDSANLHDHNITSAGFTESIVIESDGSGGSSGTQLYMAPEYLIGAPSSIRGDVFSLGVMLYQIVAGDLAKPMGSGWQRDIEDPLLREDIAKCIDVEPERRFATAMELADQLERLSERKAEQHKAREQAEYQAKLQQQAEKRRRLLALGAVALLGLLGVIAALYKGLQEQRDGMAEQMRLKEEAKTMASQADYVLANEHLKQGHANKAVAYLARALRSDPDNEHAKQRLTATLIYHNFPRRLYPPIQLSSMKTESKVTSDVTWDGRYAVTTTPQGGIKLYETASGNLLFDAAILEDPEAPIEQVLFNDTSDKLFVRREKSYQIVNIADGQVERERELTRPHYGYSQHLSRDGRYWIADHFIEPQIHVHELYGERRHLVPIPMGNHSLAHYRASPNGRYLACFWQTRTVGHLSICDLQATTPSWRDIYQGSLWTRVAPDAVSAFDHASQRIAFSTAEGDIHVHELSSGEPLRSISASLGFIMSLVFSPDDAYLATGHFSQVARVWHLQTGEATSLPMEHQGAVVGLDFSDDGSRLLTASLDGKARLWDPIKGNELCQPMQHDSAVLYAWFDDAEKQSVTISLSGQASVWGLTQAPADDAPQIYPGRLYALSSDHERYLLLMPNKEIQLYDSATRQPSDHQLPENKGSFRYRAFKEGAFLIESINHRESDKDRDNGGTLFRLNADGSTDKAVIKAPFPHTVLDYQASSGYFLSTPAHNDNRQPLTSNIELRHFESPNDVIQTLKHETTTTQGKLAPGGRYAITAIRDQAYVWDLEETDPHPKPIGSSMVPIGIDIAEHAPKVLIGTITGVAQLWDIASQTPLSESLRHDGPILLVDMNAEATIAATLSFPEVSGFNGAEFRLWNLIDSTPITPPIPISTPAGFGFTAQPHFNNGLLSLSPDGTYAILCLGDDVTRIDLRPDSRVTPPELADLAEGIAGLQVDDTTGRELPLSQSARQAKLKKGIPTDPSWSTWATWLTSDASIRAISPSSEWTQARYLKYLLNRVDPPSLKRALAISPNHPKALATLGASTLSRENNAENRSLAAFYISSALTQIKEQKLGHQLGLEGTYCSVSEVCLKLGVAAKESGDLLTARHHFLGALNAAINAYETNPASSTSQIALALSYLHVSQLSEGPKQEAYLDASIITLALLKEEGVNIGSRLERVVALRQDKDSVPAIAPNSTWHYSESNPNNAAWKETTFDVSSWKSGPGPLGYGDDFVTTAITTRPLTLYLRHTFTLTETQEASDWLYKILYDDAATLYLNGSLLHEENMKDGKVIDNAPSNMEGRYHERRLSVPKLAAGKHTLAVTVHQESPTSSDLTFDLAAFPNALSLADRLRQMDASTIEQILTQLGDDAPKKWALRWRFYHADVADAANPLAQDPGAFCQRALIQESRGRRAIALAAAQTVLRLTEADPENEWTAKAKALIKRLSP